MGRVIGERPTLGSSLTTRDLAAGVQKVVAQKMNIALRIVLAMTGFLDSQI